MDDAQVDGFVTISVPDGDVVYVDKNELGIDWIDRVDDEVDSGKSTSTSQSGNRLDTVEQLEADESTSTDRVDSHKSTSTVQSGNRVALNNLTYAQRVAIPSNVHPRPIRPQRAYFYPGHEGCHSLPLKPSQKDNDVLSISEKRAITRVRLWLRAIIQAQKNDFAELLGVIPGDVEKMSLDAILDLCDRWAKIKMGTRGLALPYMKMLLTEMFDSVISTLEKGLIRDPAIVIGTEGMTFTDLWDMPDRHDLNSGKGNYVILCRNDLTGIVSGYGGAAFGIYGMIGRWTLVNGNHWLSAQKKDTGPVCKELYDQLRTPGADFKFKSIFAWPDGTAGPEEMHCQLGEGIEVIMLDLLSRTPVTHHLRNRAYHERIRMKANDIIDQWDNDDTFGFKIGHLPVAPAGMGCNNAHPCTQGAIGIPFSTSRCYRHCGKSEALQGFRINEFVRFRIDGQGPLCQDCYKNNCPESSRGQFTIERAPDVQPLQKLDGRGAITLEEINELQKWPTHDPASPRYSAPVPAHMVRDIENIETYRKFVSSKVVCYHCGGEPHFIESHLGTGDQTLWYLLKSIGKPVCKGCIPSRDYRGNRQGMYFIITDTDIQKLVDKRKTALQAVPHMTMDEWYSVNPSVPRGHARYWRCMIPEEQGLEFKVYRLGAGTKNFVTCCEKYTRGRCKDNDYARVPLSDDGKVKWVLDPDKLTIEKPDFAAEPRCSLCGIPRWAAENVVGNRVVWSQARQVYKCSKTCHPSKLPCRFHYLPSQEPSRQDGPKSLEEWTGSLQCICCDNTAHLAWDDVTSRPICEACKKLALVLPETVDEDARCHSCAMPNWMNEIRYNCPLRKVRAGYKCFATQHSGCKHVTKIDWELVPNFRPHPPFLTYQQWADSRPEATTCSLCHDTFGTTVADGKRQSTQKRYFHRELGSVMCSRCFRSTGSIGEEVKGNTTPGGIGHRKGKRRAPLQAMDSNAKRRHNGDDDGEGDYEAVGTRSYKKLGSLK